MNRLRIAVVELWVIYKWRHHSLHKLNSLHVQRAATLSQSVYVISEGTQCRQDVCRVWDWDEQSALRNLYRQSEIHINIKPKVRQRPPSPPPPPVFTTHYKSHSRPNSPVYLKPMNPTPQLIAKTTAYIRGDKFTGFQKVELEVHS